MALIGITYSIGETFEYVLDRDPYKKTVEVPVDPDDPSQGRRTETVIEGGTTVFTLGVLDVCVMGMIYDKSSLLSRGDDGGDIGITTRINQSKIEAVRYGLHGWRNSPTGAATTPRSAVKRHTNGRAYHVVDECLKRLGSQDIRELGQEIKRRSEVSKGRGKGLRHSVVAVLLMLERCCAGCTGQEEWVARGPARWSKSAPRSAGSARRASRCASMTRRCSVARGARYTTRPGQARPGRGHRPAFEPKGSLQVHSA